MQICRGRIREDERRTKVRQSTRLLSLSLNHLPSYRYFADNVRDDYAAGQLDAQVHTLLLAVTRTDHFIHRLKVCYRRCGTCQYVGETELAFLDLGIVEYIISIAVALSPYILLWASRIDSASAVHFGQYCCTVYQTQSENEQYEHAKDGERSIKTA